MNSRTATAKDASALNKLVNNAYRGEASKQGWTTEADLLDGVRTTVEALLGMIAKPDAMLLVVERTNEILACVYLEKQERQLYLGMLTVQPQWQGKGIGADLMADAESKALALGCTSIKMTVITVRDTLIAYYQRKGFKDTGERQAFPNDPAFGIPKQPLEFMVMEKILSQ